MRRSGRKREATGSGRPLPMSDSDVPTENRPEGLQHHRDPYQYRQCQFDDESITDADEAMTWDEVTLEYGYALHRIAGGGWWHLHFGRSSWSYHCDLLGHRTDILACVQR